MEQLLEFLLQTEYATYVFAWCGFCAVFVAVAPTKLTEKIPDVLMAFINVCAINFGNAKNKNSDIKGNPQ
jgi:hypothetical protein